MDGKPNPIKDSELGNVSYHAVTRYLQRIVRVVVRGAYIDPCAEAIAHCHAAGLTLEQVRSLIWIPEVASAAKAGFLSVRTREFTVFLSDGGIVTTITEPKRKARPVPGKIKLLTEPERKRHDARLHRRRKGQSFKTGEH